ncbi:MAG: ATP synthase F1 subunit delta [Deltaproteobacteria bacterium]|nr:ATP synthase F1 subunit delta [Deltaproteobacteria bacterium]
MIGGVAKRYARALEAIGLERGNLDEILAQTERLAGAWAAAEDLRHVLENPLFPIEKRREILRSVADGMGIGEVVRNAALLLLDRSRLPELGRIALALRSMADDRAGRIRAEVVSAVELSEAYYDRLGAALETITGRKVILARRQDPSLIAGVVTRVGDRLYDGSARTRLAEIREALVEK